MHPVVPELVVEYYRAGLARGEFPAVGLFLDLSGFSNLTDTLMRRGQHGAEVLASLMHGVFDPLVDSIFDYGGKIVSFAGDGILALYPVTGDEKALALQAAASAMIIQQRLQEQPVRQTVYGDFPISVKIGLAAGAVSWGIFRSQDGKQATYYFRGSAVDGSSEAEHHASPGEIVIAPGLAEMLQGEILTRPLGSFHRLIGLCNPLAPPPRSAPPQLDISIARVFMPEEVITQDARGEFRQIVNLFMRFPDLPEAGLQELMDAVFRLREQYGGLLNRLDFGDKGCNMLMLWGAPTAYENDIGRALNFILELKSKLAFPVTAGVTYYVAHAGYLGGSMSEDYTCYGWGVNLAARFMMNAPVGQVWVDDRVARRMARRFEVELIGSQKFKGFASPQNVYLLRGHRMDAESSYPGEMVGREEELGRLIRFVEPLWQRQFAGLLWMTGDAGLGKGRLLYEFRSLAQFIAHPPLWALCQSNQLLRQSFNPFRGWLRAYFGFAAGQPAEERRQAFDAKLDGLIAAAEPDLAAELERTRSFLGALVEVAWADSLYEQLDAAGRYQNTVLALIALLKAESLRRPVILILEDFQFADEETRNFIPRLKRAILAAGQAYPLALIVTARPDGENARLPSEAGDERMVLAGLPAAALARLAENWLGHAAAPGLARFVADRSEGNPFFAEQIIRYLQEENLIEMSADGWALVRQQQDLALPSDIHALLVARLDQLARHVKESVQTAAVLGREFEIQVLATMLRDEPLAYAHLAEAEKAAIWSPLNEWRYIFHHGLLRDAAYAMQLQARRQELHALAVQALEGLYAHRLPEHAAELAYHAGLADLRAKAQRYYALAGKHAAEHYENRQAVEYFSRALQLAAPADDAQRFDLLIEREALYARLGDRGAQAGDLQSLKALAELQGGAAALARVEMLSAQYHFSIGDYPAVVESARRVMEHCRAAPQPAIELDAYNSLALALLRQGELDTAMATARAGLERARAAGDRQREGYLTNATGLILLEQKDSALAQGCFEQALALAREANDRSLEAKCLNNLGNSAGMIQGDHAAAQRYYELAYAIIHERGDWSLEGMALSNLGWTAGMQGDFPAAHSYHRRALAIAQEVDNAYQEAYTLINLSAIAGIRGEARESLDFSQSAWALAQKVGDKSAEAWAQLYLGHAFLLLQDRRQAKQAFALSIALREQLDQPGLAAEPRAGLIFTALQEGDDDEALKNTALILAYLRNGGTLEGTEEPLRVYLACYLALRQRGDPSANVVLRQAGQWLDQQLANIRDSAARERYVENVPWRRAIAEALTLAG